MSIVESTKFIGEEGHQTPLTLKRSNETGYFLLKPFLPLLQQFHQMNDNQNITVKTIAAAEVTVEQEDALLSQYGILVDTDDDGEKWITGEKAFELLQMLNLLHLFEDAFNSQNDGNKNSNHSSIHAVDPTSNVGYRGDGAGTEMLTDLDEEEEDIESTKDHSGQQSDHSGGLKVNGTIKRPSSELGLNMNSQKALGSPLKRTRMDKSIVGNHDSNPYKAEPESASISAPTKSIITFDHDMDPTVLHLPLKIQKAHTAPLVSENSQRMKLEAFLQRLLFPAIQDMASTSSNISQPPFDSLLHEIDLAFPHTPLNLNIPVDERGNTPLHWLASIANLDLVKHLVEHGSNRWLGDNIGESALVKAVKSVNNYDSGTFEELLDYLYPCLILEDTMNRTILHHIVITSGMAGCSSAAKYYLDILMGWIVKKQSRAIEGAGNDVIIDTMDLKWVISNMLNAADSNGDTCLNIASRLGNVAIVDALLDYGADPYVANKSGLRPVDFGAGTSKLHSNGVSSIGLENPPINATPREPNGDDNAPDTMSLISDMQALLTSVTRDYGTEVKEHQEKLGKLHKELNSHRELLAASRDRLAHAKQLQDEHTLLKEQLANIKQGIVEEEQKFRSESKQLGLSSEDTSGADWDSSEFDADEPFRVDFIYDILEGKLAKEYSGDIDKLLGAESLESVLKEVRSTYLSQYEDDEKLDAMLPPSVLLKARINAYKINDEHLSATLGGIRQKQKDLESKFRRVLCLCLKIDEDKVDGMLDGLLQAISSEDPQDVDTDEMHDFLKRHIV